ncbi:MAG: AAA family ATPase [Leptolyngbyaceae bacterium]|nr:AAA family ATPase [Leptolyngbyaceae bacterium]
MGTRHFGDHEGSAAYREPQDHDLLKAGWRPLNRELDWEFIWQLLSSDRGQLTQKMVNAASSIADALGRHDHAWWANALSVFAENTRYDLDEFWDYVTPKPPGPNPEFRDVLSTDTPVLQAVSRTNIPIEYVLNRLQEITVLKILALLGRPDTITQQYLERHFYYPVDRFTEWNRLNHIGTVSAFWSQHQVWLQITHARVDQRRYTLIGKDLAPLANKATYNLAVMLSGYQSRVGKVHSQYPIQMFPADIQSFTDKVQQAILVEHQLAVLVSGVPGTGKTAWTQAVAKEILAPLGYVIFILDHDAVEHFVPPSYLERICLIINEADNLAQNRASAAAQGNTKTEHILSLLDGTLYQSVIDEAGLQAQQRFVVLMTCNTTERLDPAMLRKGRVDLSHEFTHRFV